MSRAEIVAYMLGAAIESDAWADLIADQDRTDAYDRHFTAEQEWARAKLGDERFAYWAARGAIESSNERKE